MVPVAHLYEIEGGGAKDPLSLSDTHTPTHTHAELSAKDSGILLQCALLALPGAGPSR